MTSFDGEHWGQPLQTQQKGSCNKMNQGNFGIKSRLGVVASLAMVSASGVACSVDTGSQTDAQSVGQYISTPLSTANAVKYDTTSAKNEVDIIMAGETAEIYVNPADSSLMVNGQQAKDAAHGNAIAIAAGSKANIKTIKVTDTAGTKADILILNYLNGVFGLGTLVPASGMTPAAYTAGTQITLSPAMGVTNTLIVKGTALADSYAIGQTGISLTGAAKAPTLDVTTTNVTAFNFFLGDGDDSFTSNGTTAVTGAAFSGMSAPTIAIFGGNGNDTLNESAAATPNETFSGGPGTDTVDYSARTAAVYVRVDSTGTAKSGASTLTDCTYVAASVTEGDFILDADVIKGGTGDDVLMGDKTGSFTLNGGPGNDRFCEGDDTFKSATDTLVGGGGVDAVDYSLRANTLSVTLDGKTKSGDATANSGAKVTGENDLVGADVMNVYIGKGGSAMTPSVYNGNILNNTFFAGIGGVATVNGSDGDDTLDEGTDVGSTVTGVCDPTMMTLPACPANNAASETFNGGKGTDTVDYRKRTTALTVKMDGTTKGGASGEQDIIAALDVENLYGGTAADVLQGNALDNDIEGGGAGGSGNDIVCGGQGNDTLIGNTSATTDNEDLHGGDCTCTTSMGTTTCVDASTETGAFNLCFATGASGTPTVANSQNCQFVSQ
jgi:hypothetical protein